jgi:hypothetical protein
MQPLTTAEDVLRSFREIETSIFHGIISPYGLICFPAKRLRARRRQSVTRI